MSTALLVMDYQYGIIGRVSEPEALVRKARTALDVARQRELVIGYVRVAFEPSDVDAMPERNKMKAMIASAGDAMAASAHATQIHADLSPQPGDIVVRKTRVGPFTTTDLEAQLKARGVDTLVLAGISSSGVVLSTVREAADKDYRLVVLRDVCADMIPDVHEVLMDKVFPRQADVIGVDEFETVPL